MNTGSRVYYTENGPDDTGTVTLVVTDAKGHEGYQVVWDAECETDVYTSGQLTPIN